MIPTEKWFGLDSSGPLCLRSRLLAELVRKLVIMEINQDEHDPELYHFSSAKGRLSVKITRGAREYIEGRIFIIEFLDCNGDISFREEIIESGFPGIYDYHPLIELVDLLKLDRFRGDHTEKVAEIKKINELFAAL